MIECALGLLVGWYAGRPLFHAAGAIGGDASIIIFLALLDELCAAVADKRHNVANSLFMKAILISAVLWIGERTGAPLAIFAQLILLASIFRHSVWRAGLRDGGAR
ncbi:MAG: hypothetical protein WCX65_19100 [bacterium]